MEWLRRHPMWVLLVPFVAGIVCCYYTDFPVSLLRDTDVGYLDSVQTFQVVLTDYPQPRQKTVRCEVEVLSVFAGHKPHEAAGRAYLYILPDTTDAHRNADALRSMQIGDTLFVRTKIQRAGCLGDFDYGQYLRMQGVVGTAVVWSNQWRRLPFVRGVWWQSPALMRQVQHRLYERFRTLGIEGDELATLGALTLGYKEDLEPGLKRSFQRSGAAHVLAVSGLHTGILYAVLLALFTCFGRYKPMYANRVGRVTLSLLIIVSMWVYALLTGMTPSVVRSVLMVSLIELGRMCYRQGISLNTVATAAFLILLVRPRDLFSVSFQLSFAAVIAILLFSPGLVQMLDVKQTKHKQPWQYMRDLLGVSVAAQLGTLPLTLYYFGQCSNYFMLTNMMVLPLTWLIVVLAFATLCLGGIPFVGQALAWMAKGLTWLLNHTAGWVERLPGATTEMRISLCMVCLLYGAMACGYYGMRKSLWWLAGTGICLTLFCYEYTLQ